MKKKKLLKVLQEHQKMINKIDDFFEYRYRSFGPEGTKTIMMGFLETLNGNVETLNESPAGLN